MDNTIYELNFWLCPVLLPDGGRSAKPATTGTHFDYVCPLRVAGWR